MVKRSFILIPFIILFFSCNHPRVFCPSDSQYILHDRKYNIPLRVINSMRKNKEYYLRFTSPAPLKKVSIKKSMICLTDMT